MEENRNLTFSDPTLDKSDSTATSKESSKSKSPFDHEISNMINTIKEENSKSSGETEFFSSFEMNKNKKDHDFPYSFIRDNSTFLKNYSTSLQSWKGNVTAINNGNFEAELQDLTLKGTYETASFDIREVSPDDKELVKIGAAFYWNIGYKMYKGQISKESVLRFQRIIDWTEEEYDSAIDKAEEYYDLLNIN